VKKQSFITVGLFAFLIAVGRADAQSLGSQIPSRIVVNESAPIFVSPDAGLTPLRVAKEGSALNVIATEGNWYRVEFQDPQFGRRVGYLEKRHVTALAPPRREEAPLDLTVAESRPASLVAAVQEQPTGVRSSSPRSSVFPAWETSANWGLLHDDGETSRLGWNTSAAGSVTPWLSVIGEFGGNYETDEDFGVSAQLHSFMGGMRFIGRFANGRVNPFGQFLGGVEYGHVSGRLTDFGSVPLDSATSFAIQPGGGVDIGLSESIALRMQVDFRTTFYDGDGASTRFRFAPGIVIRAGRKGH
jgi:hypothetical protein